MHGIYTGWTYLKIYTGLPGDGYGWMLYCMGCCSVYLGFVWGLWDLTRLNQLTELKFQPMNSGKDKVYEPAMMEMKLGCNRGQSPNGGLIP